MSLEPINARFVWKGEDLTQRNNWLHLLSPNEVDEIQRLVVTGESPTGAVAPKLHQQLLDIQETLEHDTGAVMIRGLQLGDHSADQWATFFQNISAVVGHPISQSASGQLIFSVKDAGFATPAATHK